MKEPTKLWGGRFKAGPSEALLALSRAPKSYFRLYAEDIAGSRAHASELQRAGVLDEAEFSAIRQALDALEWDVANGDEVPNDGDEDVHTFLERLLISRLGTLGGKLRAGVRAMIRHQTTHVFICAVWSARLPPDHCGGRSHRRSGLPPC